MQPLWKKCTVGDFIKLGEIDIKTGPFGTQLKASDYVDSGTAVINVRNIGYGDLKPDKIEYITNETVQRLSGHLIKKDDIVFGRKGAVDRHLYVKEIQHNWFQGSDCLRIRIQSKSILPKYISYYLLTKFHKEWILKQCSHGATMASLNQDIICRIPLLLPPLPTQKKIASILSAYDDLIENNTRRIKILEEMARRLYREWFVHFRFPGHEKTKFVDSPLGMIPVGWEVKSVGEVLVKILRKKRIPKTEYHKDAGIPVIDQGSEMIGGYTNEIAALHTEPLPIIIFGDHTRIIKYIDFPFASGADGTQLLYPEDASLLPGYFYHMISEIDLSNYAYARHFKFLKAESVLIPKGLVLEAFNKITKNTFAYLGSLNKQNANLRHARDLLLPKLINGDITV